MWIFDSNTFKKLRFSDVFAFEYSRMYFNANTFGKRVVRMIADSNVQEFALFECTLIQMLKKSRLSSVIEFECSRDRVFQVHSISNTQETTFFE